MIPIVVVTRGQYYTDGSRLYFIMEVHKNNEITVENCETLFSHKICTDILYESWTLVNWEN